MPKIIHNAEIEFTIIMIEGQSNESGPVYVDFRVYDIIGSYPNTSIPIYHRKDYTNSDETETDIEKSQIFCHGHIKWDGCCDVHFDEQDNVMIHGCSRKDLNRIGKLFDVLYDLAAELMPSHVDNLLEDK